MPGFASATDRAPKNVALRTIVVGDLHGCLTEFDDLLGLLSHRRETDRLVLLGDFMDRGPDPVGVVRRARELGAESVLGNHDEKHLRWRAHEERRRRDSHRNPMRPLTETAQRENEALSAEDVAYLASLPPVLPLGDGWVAVHAGFSCDRPVGEQSRGVLLRVRYVDAKGRFISLAERYPSPPPGAALWSTRWPGPESVVYGHVVHDLATPRRDEPAPGVLCLGIDTGCCFGGRLTALVLPSQEIVQVQARQAYSTCRTVEE
jgi:hypothetical protein